jgi:hypothetical protein
MHLGKHIINRWFPKTQSQIKQLDYIYNFLLSKRSQVFTYGLRINFEPTYRRFFRINK